MISSCASALTNSPASTMVFSTVLPSASVTDDVLEDDAAEQALVQGLDDFVAGGKVAQADAVDRAAVLLGDDEVVRDVDEAAGQVAGVGGFKRGVGETLAAAVGGDEVLEDGQALAEVRHDGLLDDLADAAGQLLLRAWPSVRACRPADGPAGGNRGRRSRPSRKTELKRASPTLKGLVLVGLHGVEHDVRDLVRDVRPDVDDLVVALGLGDDAVLGLLLDRA